MKNIFVLFTLFFFCTTGIFSQSHKIFDSTVGQNDLGQTGVINQTTDKLGGPLLSEGIMQTSFPDYSGNLHPMSIVFNGTYYYVVGGGNSPGDVALLDQNFNLITTQSVGLDCRSAFYNPADGQVYIKGLTSNGLFRLHTSPFDGSYDVVYTNLFQNSQSKVCISSDGQYLYDEYNGTVVKYQFSTGLTVSTITLNLQHDLTWPRGNLIAHSGTYLITFADNKVYAYDPSNGNSISSCNLSTMPASSEWSMSYTNGMFFVTNSTEDTWYAWKIDSGVLSADDNSLTPSEFSLKQNYPNPFNPSTSIDFSIASESFVTLKIFDILGNEITTLVNENRPTGNYSIEFNAADLPSGIYFYKLQAGSLVETKKMTLMK